MRVLLVVFVIAMALAIMLFRRDQSVPPSTDAVSSGDAPVSLPEVEGSVSSIPSPPPISDKRTELPVAADTSRLHQAGTSPRGDLELIDTLLEWHRRAVGNNPVGFNDEITAALSGRNVKGVVTLPADHPAISKDGQLLDRWGTPYRFHAISSEQMDILSAGPDKTFNTEDDIALYE